MQNLVKEFIIKNNLSSNEQIRYIDLVSEVGELGKEIIKSTNYGEKPYLLNATTFEEMGDCLFSILALCCELNIEAEEALKFVIEKYNKRLDATGTIGSGQ